MPKSTDIRAMYTKERLKDAMFQLLETKDFYHITVHAICDKASISRTTFYLHFEDKYELTCYCIESLVSDLQKHIHTGNLKEAVNQMLTSVYHHRKALKSLIALGGDEELQRRIDAMFLEIFLEFFHSQEVKGTFFSVPVELLARFHCAGTSSLMLWWINNNFPVSPETMLSYLYTTVIGQ